MRARFSRVKLLNNIESPIFFLSYYSTYFYKQIDTMFFSLWLLITEWSTV